MLATMTGYALLGLLAAPAGEALFCPPGMWTNDNWFAREGDTWHAFYLQTPSCMADPNDWSIRAKLHQIGHATSTDLVHWTDRGPVVVPTPGKWYGQLATGSVAKFQGKWWMVFTVGGPRHGIGLAWSDDLNTWHPVGDAPVVLTARTAATWQGKAVEWVFCADPYLYPEPIDGWMVMALNAKIVGAPANSSGCVSTLRSKDMLTWEPGPILAYPGLADRLETPQVWRHGDRWYLYAGVAHDQPELPALWQATAPASVRQARRANVVFQADRFEGPYEPRGEWLVNRLPDGRYGYIHKVLARPDGSEVLITTTDGALSLPYRVSYAADGSVVLAMP